MNSRIWTFLLSFNAVMWVPTSRAVADITNFAGFAPVNLNTGAMGDPLVGYSPDFTTYTVTNAVNGQISSGFYLTPQDISGFTLSFTYQSVPGYHDGVGAVAADGIALIFQNSTSGSTTALGGGGGDKGYHGITAPSAALLFDVFGGFYNFPGATGFQFNGMTGTPNGLTNVNLSDGNPVTVSLSYSGTTLVETVTSPLTLNSNTFTYTNIDLPTNVGSSTAYVGFSGATGGYNALQKVSNFQYTQTVPEPGAWMALLGGAGCLGFRRRRRA